MKFLFPIGIAVILAWFAKGSASAQPDPNRTAHQNFLEIPQFRTDPLPPEYLGKTAQELATVAVNGTNPAVTAKDSDYRWNPRGWFNSALTAAQESEVIAFDHARNGVLRITNNGGASFKLQMKQSTNGTTWTNLLGEIEVAANATRNEPIGTSAATLLKFVAVDSATNVSLNLVRNYAASAPEFRPNSLLDKFVDDMERDPLALAAFVHNEIALVDAIRPKDRLGDVAGPQSSAGGSPAVPPTIIPSAMRRNAYTTYLDRQGSPYEQCNLLTYLLRQAGYAAALVNPDGAKVKVLSNRLSNMLQLQVKGFLPLEGPGLYEVDYPWVVFRDPATGAWRHLFPWLKDTVIEEGFNLYEHLPAEYDCGRKWLEGYLKNHPAVNEFVGDDGDDTPSTMFKEFVSKHVASQGLSLKDIGVRIYDRKNIYSDWNDFPRPFSVEYDANVSSLALKADWKDQPSMYSYIDIRINDNHGTEVITTARRSVSESGPVNLRSQYAMDFNGRSIYAYLTAPEKDNGRYDSYLVLCVGASDPVGEVGSTGNANDYYSTVGFPDLARYGGEVLYVRKLASPKRWEFHKMAPDRYVFGQGGVVDLSQRGVVVTWRDSAGNPIVPASERRCGALDVAGINLKLGGVTVRGVDALRVRLGGLGGREHRLGAITHLVGQAYFERVQRLGRELQNLHKCQADVLGLGVTVLTDDGVGTIVSPRIDMPMFTFPYWNSSLRPDQGEGATRVEVLRDFSNILAAELSAQEHVVINEFYHQKDAISTVKLLRLANETREIVRGPEVLGTGPGADAGLEFPNGFYEMDSAGFQSRYTAAEAATVDATPTTPASVISDLKGVFTRFNMDGNLGLTGTTPNQIPLSNRPAFVQKWSGAPTNEDFLAAFGTQTAATANNVFGNFKTGDSWAKLKTWSDENEGGKLYITPGPVKGADSATKPSYIGWGSLMVGLGGNLAGWIEGNQAVYNGGFGARFSAPYSDAFGATTIPNLSIAAYGNDFYLTSPHFGSFNAINASWQGVDSWSAGYNLTPQNGFNSAPLQGAYSMGFGSLEQGWAGAYNQGYFGDAQFHRSWSSSPNYVEDPVNIVNGEFYCDEVDLTLPGPLPLELRRNYSSQSEANTLLGPGWKLSLMPYLSIAGKNPGEEGYDAAEHAGKHKGYLIHAADWDGSVLAFREQTVATTATWAANSKSITVASVAGISVGQFAIATGRPAPVAGTPYIVEFNAATKVVTLSDAVSTTLGTNAAITFSGGGPWRVDAADNPGLKNFNGKDVDELNNPFHERIVRTGTAVAPIYTWYRADGTKATYTWRSFPMKVVESASISKDYSRAMPYLSKIEDLAGNTLDFSFYTISNAAAGVAVELSKAEVGYGQLKKVRSSNGNFLVFNYDSQQRISDVYSNDGRRVQYRYDSYGDLTEVELPDAAVHTYQYKHDLAPRPDSKKLTAASGAEWSIPSDPAAPANTGTRIKGWLQPQVTGDYKFQLTGTGEMKLTIGSGADPAAAPALSLSGQLPAGGTSLTSGVVSLAAGGSYYIETRHFDTAAAAAITLKWQKPGDSAATWTTIKKADLKPYQPDPAAIDTETKPIMAEFYQDVTPATLAGMEAAVRFTGLPYSNNLLIKATDAEGRVTINEYDASFRPEHPVFGDYKYRRVVKQWSTSGEDMEPILTAEYQYDPIGNPWLSAAGGYKVSLLIDKTRSANYVTTYVHKDGCLVYVAQPDAVGFAPENTNIPYVATYQWEAPQVDGRQLRRVTENRDLRGLRTIYSYGADGLLAATTAEGELTGEGAADSAVTNYFYNADRRLIKTVLPSPGGSRKTEVVYASYPALAPGVDRAVGLNPSRTDDFIYRHRPLSVARYAEASPSRTTAAAPLASAKIEETRYTYIEKETNAAFARALVGETRKLEFKGGAERNIEGYDVSYDGRGYPTGKTTYTYVTGPGTTPSVTETYVHDARGLMIRNIGPAGRMKRLAYDPRGRPVIEEEYPSSSAQLPLIWDYSYYNQMGELIWKDGPRYSPEDYQFFDYDGAGRKIVEATWRTQANAAGTDVEAAADYSIVYHYYDGFGNRIKSVDPQGNYTAMAYDAMGRMIQSSSYDSAHVLLSTEAFTYEPGSEVATHVDPLGGTTTTQYTMDGKPMSVARPDGSSQSWTYYLDGRVKTHVLENAAVWTYTYDDLLLKEIRVLVLGGTVIDKKILTSDALGRVVAEETFAGEASSFVTIREFDGVGRLVRETGPPGTVLAGGAASEQQEKLYQYSFDTGNHTDTVTISEGGGRRVSKAVTDNLGREAYSEVRDQGGNLLQSSTKSYDPKHHFVKVTRGSDAVVNAEETVYSDTLGKPVIWKLKDSDAGGWKYRIAEYDRAGNNVRNTDEQGKVTLNEYDGLNRLKTKTYPDEARVEFGYDSAGNLIRRAMPGNLVWHALYDEKGQQTYEMLQQDGGGTTRHRTFLYYPEGDVNVGLLQEESFMGGGVVTHTYSYDGRRRPTGKNSSGGGTLPVSSTTEYDFISRPINSSRTCREITTTLAFDYDGYGQVLRETISVEGAVQSQLNQKWDSLGFRTGLKKGGDAPALAGAGYQPDFAFDYYSNGSLKGVSTHDDRYRSVYTYADNSLITSSELLDGSASIRKVLTPLSGAYDTRGRLIGRSQHAAGGQIMAESVQRRGDSRISLYDVTRGNGGGGNWGNAHEQRTYGYDDRGKLASENYLTNPEAPSAAYVTGNLAYQFDSDKLGFLTEVTKGGQPFWNASKNAFARATSQVSYPALRTFQVKGTAHGPGRFALYVAPGTPVNDESYAKVAEFVPTPRSSSVVGQPNADWNYPLSLAPGSYTVQARARMTDHPARPYEAKSGPITVTVDGSNFNRYQVGYNSRGQIANRVWGANDEYSQTFQWAADDRLESVTYTYGTDGYIWTAVYDPAGRRVRTSLMNEGESAAKEIRSWYDPEVEFLEVAVEFAGKRHWKLTGPDLLGAYGSAQGQGGCEAIIDEKTGLITPLLDDIYGNVVGRVDTAGTPSSLDDQVIWSGLQMSGYGVLPGFAPVSLEHSGDLLLSMNWQGRRVDPTGFYNMGTRSYDPESRRFLSADPLGHASSMDLYSYANGDPINHIDPDGRFARLVGDGISGLFEFTGLQSPITPERSMANSFSIGSNSFSIGENSYQTISHINERYQPFEKAASAFVNMVPGVGTLKSFIEMSGGNDLFTGEQTSQGGAAFNVVASALPVGMGGVSKWASTAMPGTLSAGLSGGGRGFAGTAGNPWGVAPKGPPNPGGRLGKDFTRTHIDDVATEMEKRGFEITGGGNRLPEEYLPGPGGKRKGSSFPDITATKNGRTVRVNTIDTRVDGVTPTTREAANAARIRSQTPGDHLLLVPKPKP